MTEDVLLETRGPLRLVTLHRPRALNALNLGMIRVLHPQLEAWATSPDVRAVVIRGAGEKAFCAGGDVRAVHESLAREKAGEGDGRLGRDFFREEYRLNHLIHTFPKPFIALVDGICMGGGVGLSVHGSHRVVTERLVLAMPETAIGIFPDVGGGWFLPRCPGELGTYLGLTGARCGAADALHVGYATHHVPAARLPALLDALEVADFRGEARAVVDGVLARFAEPAGTPPLEAMEEAIQRCFAHARVEDVLQALVREGSAWAADVRATLTRMSPFGLKVTLALLRRGRALSYPEVVTLEYRLARACTSREDFHQGIRAVLVEKHGRPHWRPSTLEEVTEAMVEEAFGPLPPGEELVVA